MSPEEEAYLSLRETHEVLVAGLARLLSQYHITTQQYNALRALRRAEGKLSSQDVAAKMITRVPDITRLLDRLERMGWVSRCRSTRDRRVVWVHLTPEGQELLHKLDEPVLSYHRQQLGHMKPEELVLFMELLRKARVPES